MNCWLIVSQTQFNCGRDAFFLLAQTREASANLRCCGEDRLEAVRNHIKSPHELPKFDWVFGFQCVQWAQRVKLKCRSIQVSRVVRWPSPATPLEGVNKLVAFGATATSEYITNKLLWSIILPFSFTSSDSKSVSFDNSRSFPKPCQN